MLLIYGLAVAQMLLFVGVTYAIARAFGLAPRVIGLGTPALLRVRRGSPEIRVGLLPSASVDLAGEGIVQGKRVIYGELSRGKRVAIIVAPWIVVLGIAIACLGAEPALRSFVRGFAQWLVVPDLTPLVKRLIAIAREAPVATTAGIVMAKLAAMNLAPFGGLAGGALIQQLATPPGRDAPKPVMTYLMITLIAWLLWALGRLVYTMTQLA